MTTATLDLSIGFASVEARPLVSSSDWRQGISLRRARSARVPRTWRVRWDGVGVGAVRYLQALFLTAGQGADVVGWTPPNNEDLAVEVRFVALEHTMKSISDFTIQATLEEAI